MLLKTNYKKNPQCVHEQIKEEIKKYLETNENKHNFPKSMGHSKSSSKKEDTSQPEKTRKISNNLTFHLTEFKKKTKPKGRE